MISLAMERVEFSTKRRKAQDEIAAALVPVVTRALDLGKNTGGWNEVLEKVETIWREQYAIEAGEHAITRPSQILTDAVETLRKTNRSDQPDPATVDRITLWLATLILNSATAQAAVDDPEEVHLEWVTMHDKSVREAHRAADGQVRPVGENFDVDGVPMPYPGYPGVDPALWMNCRCTLRPTLPEALVAAISDKPWDGSAARFTPEQWKSSCILHTCDGMEKSCHHLPIKEPGGALSRAGVHAAAGRINQVDASDAQKASARSALRGAYKQLGEDPPDSLAAAVDNPSPNQEVKNTSTVVVALPSADDEINQIGDEQKHVTLAFLGVVDDALVPDIQALVAQAAEMTQPMVSMVGGSAVLGPDKAKVLILEDPDLITVREWLLEEEPIRGLAAEASTFSNVIMHLTLTYGDMPPEAENVSEITFDRLAVWHGDQQTEYALGGADMSQTDAKAPEVDGPPKPDQPVVESNAVPWFGPLAPEGIKSGDGRRFAEGSLDHRPLPLPLTWQKISDDGHRGNVTVAKIERVVMYDGRFWGCGHFINNIEADETVGLIGEFGKFGVSVDADSAEFDLNETDDCLDYTMARISSACIVPIPAFAEAWVSLGEWPEEVEAAWQEANGVAGDMAMVASLTEMAEKAEFKDLAPGKTEDGPGWLTHPVDTDRLRDYWVRGPGAAKIGWGTPGDFNRCRALTAEYVKPQYLNGYCANRHYDALGFWPGRPVAGDTEAFAAEKLGLEATPAAEVLTLVASGALRAPAEWFADPEFAPGDGRMIEYAPGEWACPLTVTDEGEVFAHIAAWNSCHFDSEAYGEVCVKPPHSETGYAYFLHGAVHLDNGEKVPVGPLTVGGGHANGRLGLRAALEHYDNASTAWADVAVGEDDYGIWCHGWVRPGTSQEMITAAVASPLSGDWRVDPRGNLEMIIAHCVNSPGYLVPRVRIAAANGEQVSLVAAGGLPPRQEAVEAAQTAGIDLDALAALIVVQIAEMQARKAEMAALAAEITQEA